MIFKHRPFRLKYFIVFALVNGLLALMFTNMSNIETVSAFAKPDVCSAGGNNLECFKKYLADAGEYKNTQDISMAVKSLKEICGQKPISESNKKICYYSAINNTFEKIDYSKFFLHVNQIAKTSSKKSYRAKEKKELDKLLRQQRAHISKLYKAEKSTELKFKILQVIATLDTKTTELAKY